MRKLLKYVLNKCDMAIEYMKALGLIILAVIAVALLALTFVAVMASAVVMFFIFTVIWIVAWLFGVPVDIKTTMKVPGKIVNITKTETYRWFTKINK